MQSLCGGKFDPHYFTRYLKENILRCTSCNRSKIPAVAYATGGIVYCLFTPKSTLGSAGGDALDVELLHDDKQHRDGDSHQDAACAEAGEVAVDQSLLQHVVQADCHRPVRRNAGVQDHLCHNKVGPRRQEGADNGVHQDRAGHRDDDLEEDARFRSAVQLGGSTQATGTV